MTKPEFSDLLQNLEGFDTRVDEHLEALRDSPVAARVFTSASHLGDFSLIWHIVASARGVTSERRAAQALALSALLGAESLIVNQGIKKLFRRQRPTESGDERFDVRTPSTSSFPSGHASSAFFAATLLTSLDGRRSAPMWFGLASVVATSRVFVRIHHASDVIGGAIVGLGLGILARPLVKGLK
jgi:membrane-associated phospholipid phosphatase